MSIVKNGVVQRCLYCAEPADIELGHYATRDARAMATECIRCVCEAHAVIEVAAGSLWATSVARLTQFQPAPAKNEGTV